MKKIYLLFLLLPSLVFCQDSSIKIHLKNGEVLPTSYLRLENNAEMKKPYALMDSTNGKKIPIDLVSFIENRSQSGSLKYYKPVSYRSGEVWAERSYTNNKVNIFEFDVAKKGTSYSSKKKLYKYNMEGSSVMREIKYSNLKSDISNNATSMGYLKKANKIRVTQAVISVVAGAVMVIGFKNIVNKNAKDISQTRDEPLVPTPVVVGAGILLFPAFMNKAKKEHLLSAIKAYE